MTSRYLFPLFLLVASTATCKGGIVRPTVFNVGDSVTLQSQTYLKELIPGVITSRQNALDSFFTAENIVDWMNAPYANGDNFDGEYDIVRWNNGIWDALPHELTSERSTSAADFATNLKNIVQRIRSHSPDAKIIFSTSPLMDYIDFGDDEPPHNWLATANYNSHLEIYRDVALETLPELGVLVDDKFAFYQEHRPSDFGLVPSHHWTGEHWRFDRIHFDSAFREFEAEQTAAAILRTVPEPNGILMIVGGVMIFNLVKRPSNSLIAC